MYRLLGSVSRRLPMCPNRNRPVISFASWPTNTARLWRLNVREKFSVLLHVQSVVCGLVSLMELALPGSEFSAVIGLYPRNTSCERLNQGLVLTDKSLVTSRPA